MGKNIFINVLIKGSCFLVCSIREEKNHKVYISYTIFKKVFLDFPSKQISVNDWVKQNL